MDLYLCFWLSYRKREEYSKENDKEILMEVLKIEHNLGGNHVWKEMTRV